MTNNDERTIKLDIGSGRAKLPGYITVDNDEKVGADICADILDLNDQMMLKHKAEQDQPVDEIRAFHILEHLDPTKKVQVMRFFHELLKPGGILDIEVPIAGTPQFWQDPTHISGWVRETFWYFTKGNKFGEAFAKRNSDARLFEFVEEETRNGWAYHIKLRKPL